MTIDESCAFDCVRYELLTEKMKLYNFAPETIEWFENYLGSQTNYVTINAKNSKMVKVEQGVPQGSVLGPLVYTLFINKMPEIIKDELNCQNFEHDPDEYLFGPNCSKCGSIPSYADDATVLISSNSRESNQNKITEQ